MKQSSERNDNEQRSSAVSVYVYILLSTVHKFELLLIAFQYYML